MASLKELEWILNDMNNTFQILAGNAHVCLRATLFALSSTIIGITFYIGLVAGRSLQSMYRDKIGWFPKFADISVGTLTTLVVWYPGISIWGPLAGMLIAKTRFGNIYMFPALIVGSITWGFYLGRRQIEPSRGY